VTAQVSERLNYQGKKYNLCEEPLAGLLVYARLPVTLSSPSTALWRGYVGEWTIEADRLYLTGITGHVRTAEDWRTANLAELFPGFPNGLFAHWYTGELRVPMGRLLSYRHAGFASVTEFDLFLRFERGVFKERRMVTNGQASAASPAGYQVGAATFFPGGRDE